MPHGGASYITICLLPWTNPLPFIFFFKEKIKSFLSGWSDFFRYIEEGDLLRFLEEEEVHTIFPLFEGAMETGKINKSAFKNWMVSFTDTPLSLSNVVN